MIDIIKTNFLNPVKKSTGVLFAYKARSTGLAPPVFISRRIVFGFFTYI